MVRRLGEVGTIVTGGTPPTADPANYGEEYLFVGPGDIDDGKHVVSAAKMLSQQGWALARHIPKDAVLFVCIGSTIGKCAMASAELSTNQQINAICPSQEYSADFVYYAACLAAPRIRAIAGEQAVPIVNKSVFSETEILVPPLAEQRAITAALSDVDAQLGAVDRIIAKKRDLKQSTMQQLLTGQTRLPGLSGKWETKRLGEICDIAIGRTPSRVVKAFWGRGHTWLSIADLRSKVVSESAEQVTAAGAAGMTIVPKGTLLMSFKLSIGRLCFAGCELYTNEAICSFQRLQDDANYLYYALGRTDFSLYGKQAVKGYTLNKESLKLIKIALPERREQEAISAALSDMDAELAALEQRRDKTRLLKQGMMQELLTGRTRLV